MTSAITSLNRGNAQSEVFHNDGDYRAFVELMACHRIPMRVLTYCVMQIIFIRLCGQSSDKDLGCAGF